MLRRPAKISPGTMCVAVAAAIVSAESSMEELPRIKPLFCEAAFATEMTMNERRSFMIG